MKILNLGLNVYSNILRQSLSTQKVPQSATAIVIGCPGVGKTQLINRLCNQNNPFGVNKNRLTNQIKNSTCCYNQNFSLYDTPGLDIKKRQSEADFASIFEIKQWDCIFILGKLSTRFEDQTICDLLAINKMLSKFIKYHLNVVYLISHIDFCDQKKMQQTMRLLEESLNQNIQSQIIIFSNIYSQIQTLSLLLHSCAVRNKITRNYEQEQLILQKYNQREKQFKEFESENIKIQKVGQTGRQNKREVSLNRRQKVALVFKALIINASKVARSTIDFVAQLFFTLIFFIRDRNSIEKQQCMTKQENKMYQQDCQKSELKSLTNIDSI